MKLLSLLGCLLLFNNTQGQTKNKPADKKDTLIYSASYELPNAKIEDQLFYNLANTRALIMAESKFKKGITNTYCSQLRPKTDYGTAILLKVDSSDIFNLYVEGFLDKKGKYNENVITVPGKTTLPPLIATILNYSTTGQGKLSIIKQNQTTGAAIISDILKQDPAESNTNLAALNWALLDDSLRLLKNSGAMGFCYIKTPGRVHYLQQQDIAIKHSGYFLVFLNNHSQTANAFFDNLSITHIKNAGKSPAGSFIITEDNFIITTENNINLITEN